ncbi:MAG: cytochrome c biogenesis protein CcdA [Gemmatimonadales bacterium]|nr:cytochrome c biogenesis protein CcdA [Gemmatimonadales bacterium]
MSESASLGIAVAFFAGILSFLSPCVLPLVPSYIGFLTGVTKPDAPDRRRAALLHAMMFVIGFSLVFIALGATATALGQALRYYSPWIQRVGGVLIILFGLYCLGVLKLRFLQREQRVHVENKPLGYLGSALVGVAFGAGWTPCIGPILGAILTVAATEQSVGRGMLLLAFYSLGLAIPFLAAAVALEAFFDWFQGFRRYLPWVMRVSGVLLVFVGVLMVSGEFSRLAGWLQGLTPDFLRERL